MDTRKLNEYVQHSMLSINEQARKMGMSRSCWYRKRNGKSEFTVPEITRCCYIFNIDNKEKDSIFFSNKVS